MIGTWPLPAVTDMGKPHTQQNDNRIRFLHWQSITDATAVASSQQEDISKAFSKWYFYQSSPLISSSGLEKKRKAYCHGINVK